MVRCGFCGEQIERGTGKIFVDKSGKITYFCSTRCEKNMLKLKRKPKNLKWTKFYKKEK